MVTDNHFAELADTCRADLHLHTVASDGAWEPGELVYAAKRARLQVIAVTDHDTTSGIEPVQRLSEEAGLLVIPGVELSTRGQSKEEIHIVGLWISPCDEKLKSAMNIMRTDRQGRAEQIIERLIVLGVPVTLSRVHEIAGSAAVGRVHIARALVEARHVTTVNEAFERFLRVGAPAYVSRKHITPREAISAIHKAGGIAICAHPGLIHNDAVLPRLVAAGLDGLEVYHSAHSAQDVTRYEKLACEYNLLVSGGSDCHGPLPGKNVLLGSVCVGGDVVRDLYAAAKKRHKS